MAPALRTRRARIAASAAWISRCSGAQASDDRQRGVRVVDDHAGRLPGQRGLHPLGVPRLRGRLRQLGVHPVGQRRARGDQQARGQRVVLGLGDEVGGDEAGVGAVVGDDGDLGRAGLGVDGDPLAQQPLGRRDVDVARPGDDVDRGALVGAVPEHGDGLRAAGRVHLGDAEQRAGGQDRRVRQAAVLGLRRRGDRDLGDAGDLGRDDVHQHRRGVGDQARLARRRPPGGPAGTAR